VAWPNGLGTPTERACLRDMSRHTESHCEQPPERRACRVRRGNTWRRLTDNERSGRCVERPTPHAPIPGSRRPARRKLQAQMLTSQGTEAAQLLASDAFEASALRSKNSVSRSSPTRRTISATSLRLRSANEVGRSSATERAGTDYRRVCAPVARQTRQSSGGFRQSSADEVRSGICAALPCSQRNFGSASDAGAEGLEPPAYGFGDRRSTN
jgi:hypothetical protein